MNKLRSALLRVRFAIVGILGLFFVFYTGRLLYVTHGLTQIRAGGNGTYIGAVAFPTLALVFGFGAWRTFKSAQRIKAQSYDQERTTIGENNR